MWCSIRATFRNKVWKCRKLRLRDPREAGDVKVLKASGIRLDDEEAERLMKHDVFA